MAAPLRALYSSASALLNSARPTMPAGTAVDVDNTGRRMIAAASDATNHHHKTAGGIPLYSPRFDLDAILGRSGPRLFNPRDTRLRWAPPAQTAPTIITLSGTAFFNNKTYAWTNTSGNGRPSGNRVFDDDEDVIIYGSSSQRAVDAKLQIEGGRHVRLIGGKNRGRVLFLDQTGSIYVEGVSWDLSGVSSDALEVDGKDGYRPDIYCQNLYATGIHGESAGEHADFIQPVGPIGVMRVDKCTFSTNYQGIFLTGAFPIAGALISRVDCAWDAITKVTTGTHPLYIRQVSGQSDPLADHLFPVELNAVYMPEHDNDTPTRAAVFPDNSQGMKGCITDTAIIDADGTVRWDPEANIIGKVIMGAPPGGSFVNSANVGLGYTAAIDFQIPA